MLKKRIVALSLAVIIAVVAIMFFIYTYSVNDIEKQRHTLITDLNN